MEGYVDKLLIKSLWELKGYSSTGFLREFQTKNLTERGLDLGYLLAKMDRIEWSCAAEWTQSK